MLRSNITFVIKVAALYCALALVFSIVGIFLPEKGPQANPLYAFSEKEIIGHMVWGLAAGAASLSLRYFLLTGSLAILIDSDHLIGLLNIDVIPRMGHSIAFGIISVVILMVLFGKRDYLLGATVFGGLLAHLSFDAFSDGAEFPLFTPLYNNMIQFPSVDWIFPEILAVAVIGFTMLLTRRKNYLQLRQFKN
jgi:hypothetical protein